MCRGMGRGKENEAEPQASRKHTITVALFPRGNIELDTRNVPYSMP